MSALTREEESGESGESVEESGESGGGIRCEESVETETPGAANSSFRLLRIILLSLPCLGRSALLGAALPCLKRLCPVEAAFALFGGKFSVSKISFFFSFFSLRFKCDFSREKREE